MKDAHRKTLLVLLMAAQLLAIAAWWVAPKTGREWYRFKQRTSALAEWTTHPSPTTQAAYRDEEKRLLTWKLSRTLPWLVLVVAAAAP